MTPTAVIQIQIQPVENGFVVQAVNVDGGNLSRRFVATTREDLVAQVKTLADVLYTAKETSAKPTPTPPQTQPPAPSA